VSLLERRRVLSPIPDSDGGCGPALSTDSFNGSTRKGIFIMSLEQGDLCGAAPLSGKGFFLGYHSWIDKLTPS
jgi:hypothetical protein